ncbi:hypothetical protein D3C86_1514160 [compost metagenome]
MLPKTRVALPPYVEMSMALGPRPCLMVVTSGLPTLMNETELSAAFGAAMKPAPTAAKPPTLSVAVSEFTLRRSRVGSASKPPAHLMRAMFCLLAASLRGTMRVASSSQTHLEPGAAPSRAIFLTCSPVAPLMTRRALAPPSRLKA